MRQKQQQENKNWQDQVIKNLISKDHELRQSNEDLRNNLNSYNNNESSERLQTQTGYETTEFTTDGALHIRNQEKSKYGVDFNREHSEAEADNYGRQLRNENESPLSGGQNEDQDNLYTTEMEEGEENDLKARKSIIRSELNDESF